MTQIIVLNDTGADIAAAAAITLDGVNNVPPVEKVISASLVNMYNADATLVSATPTALAETATVPASGNYVYLSADNELKLGVKMAQSQTLVADVLLKGELIRT